MGLTMKKFNILEIHWKTQFLGGVHEKPIERGDCLKRGLGQFAHLEGAWQERGRVGVSEGSWYSNTHYDCSFWYTLMT